MPTPITPSVLTHPDGFFFNLRSDSRAILFNFDYDGHDLRYGWVPIADLLELAVENGDLVYYDLRTGLAVDTQGDTTIADWLEWYLENGANRQEVIRRAAIRQAQHWEDEARRKRSEIFQVVEVIEQA